MATLPTSIDDLTTVVADNYPAAGDAVAPNVDDLLRLHAGSIADLRDIGREAFVAIEDKRFGGAGDDSTDNTAALTSAVASGAVVQFGEGTYRFTVSGATGMTISGTNRLRGQGIGKTTLKFILSGTTTTSLFNITGRFEMEGLTVEVVNPDGAQIIFFNGTGLTNFRAHDCRFDGGVTNSGSTVTYTAYGINFGSTGTHEDISFVDCKMLRFHWFVQKANSATSTQRRLKFIRCDFRYFYRTPMAFNSPMGIMDDILVQGCSFRDHLGQSASLVNCFYLGTSGTTNLRVIGNNFSGSVDQAMHLEEGPHGFTVTGNLIDVDGSGICLLDNSNSGGNDSPEDGVVANNVVRKTDRDQESGTTGIWLINDATGYTPAKRTKVCGNQVYGFEYGIVVDSGIEDSVSVNDNDAHDCAYGYSATEASMAFSGNRSYYCTVGVTGTNGALYRDHGFIECTTAATDGGRSVVLINPYWEFAPVSVGAASNTYFALIALASNNRVSGSITGMSTTSTSGDTDFTYDVVKWDGTTATVNSGSWDAMSLTVNGGGTSLTTVDNSGVLSQRLYSTSARTSVRVVAHLNGAVRVAA